jgi:DNA-binding transcriptional MerR regulator
MKRYSITKTAKKLGVVRQTIYNWIDKGWVTPKRDYKGHPVFTDDDLKKIKEWKDKLEEV